MPVTLQIPVLQATYCFKVLNLAAWDKLTCNTPNLNTLHLASDFLSSVFSPSGSLPQSGMQTILTDGQEQQAPLRALQENLHQSLGSRGAGELYARKYQCSGALRRTSASTSARASWASGLGIATRGGLCASILPRRIRPGATSALYILGAAVRSWALWVWGVNGCCGLVHAQKLGVASLERRRPLGGSFAKLLALSRHGLCHGLYLPGKFYSPCKAGIASC